MGKVDGKTYLAGHQYTSDAKKLTGTGGLGPKMNNQAPRLLNALKELHNKGFTHGDIKPHNFLVDKEGNINIADFGDVRNLEKLNTLKAELEADPNIGWSAGDALGQYTLAYTTKQDVAKIAEKDVRGDTTKILQYTAKRDVYSMGVSLYQMTTGISPKNLILEAVMDEAASKIEKGEIPSDFWSSDAFRKYCDEKVEDSVSARIKEMQGKGKIGEINDAAKLKLIQKEQKNVAKLISEGTENATELTKEEKETRQASRARLNEIKIAYYDRKFRGGPDEALDKWLANPRTTEKLKNQMIEKGADKNLAGVIAQMMNPNPDTRITLDEAIKQVQPKEISQADRLRMTHSHTLQPGIAGIHI